MKRVVGWILLGVAACLIVFAFVAQFTYHDFKDFGSLMLACFFVALAGWMVGDF